jgi:O-antigen/teichoic acid export membrane protein
MATEFHSNESLPAATHERPVAPRRLWFGLVTSAAAWVGLGLLDILICWRACTRQQGYGIPDPHPWARALFFVLALVLLALTVVAGFTSYRNWRKLSLEHRLLDAQGVERREFMAIVGVIISVTLGMGIVWLALPPLFLDLCWRAK